MLMAVQAVQGLDDEYVATSAFDGTNWTAPARITGGSGPALVWVGGKIRPAHSGTPPGRHRTMGAEHLVATLRPRQPGNPATHRRHRHPHLPALLFADN
jgi:hypothetical protein